MTINRLDNSRLLLIILAYGLLAMSWNLNFNSVYHDEALNILMGRDILLGRNCPGCPQNTGSVLIQPIFASLGDAIGGLHGARAVSIPFGLGLTYIIYLISRNLFSERIGFFSALIFLFSGTTLYLSKLATYDIVSAFFLGLSLLLIILSRQKKSFLWLVFGSVSLFLSVMTKYVAAVYILPFLLFVFWRQNTFRVLIFFVAPLVVLITVYGIFAIYPVREALLGSSTSVYHQSQVPFTMLSSWTFRWIAMPYLLAIFGIFHKERGKIALLLIALSAPIILLHLISGVEQSVNKNVIFAILVLTPASALGVEQMGRLFSSNMASTWVKPFFITVVFAIIWAFGIHELRWLEHQYPDMTPVIDFFEKNGYNGMTVTIDSDFGDAVYTYSLSSVYSNAVFFSIQDLEKKLPSGTKPDFIILDEFYGKNYFNEIAKQYIKYNYNLIKVFHLRLSWGIQSVQIFQRREL
ncbi:MAG: ArnT family glycosyltransferase [Nitrospirota bacterium]